MKYYLFNTGQYVENYVLWGDLRSKFVLLYVMCLHGIFLYKNVSLYNINSSYINQMGGRDYEQNMEKDCNCSFCIYIFG